MMTEQGEKINPAALKSLLKLVYVMAIKGYSYNPDDSKSSVPREIEEDAASLDISITDETISKWLKESVKMKQTDL